MIEDNRGLSRRGVLFAAAAFGALVAGAVGQPAHATLDENLSMGADGGPEDESSFLTLSQAGSLTDLAGVHKEYALAAATFPFVLPDGYQFPAHSSLVNLSGREEMWETGSGAAEAYMFWQASVVSAAHTSSGQGRTDVVAKYLDELESAYASRSRERVQIDPEGRFPDAIRTARNGDFGLLTQLTNAS